MLSGKWQLSALDVRFVEWKRRRGGGEQNAFSDEKNGVTFVLKNLTEREREKIKKENKAKRMKEKERLEQGHQWCSGYERL